MIARRFSKITLVLVLAVGFLFCSETALRAFPRFALQFGSSSCGDCHVDPSGGGMRSHAGDAFAMSQLPMWKRGEKLSTTISDGIRIGADLRTQYLRFGDRYEVQQLGGGSHDTTVAIQGMQLMAMPIYLEATLSGAVDALLRYDPVNSDDWQAFVTLHVVDPSGDVLESGSVVSDAYVKFGAFLPTFGTRFDDHTIYTRSGNASLSQYGAAGFIWSPTYKDEGVELGGVLFDQLSISADLLNGNERLNTTAFKADPFGSFAYSLRAVFTQPLFDNFADIQVGASGYFHDVTVDPSIDSDALTRIIAIHGGLRVGRFSALAEYDMGENIYHPLQYVSSDTANAFVVQGTVQAMQGLAGIVRYETYNGRLDGALQTQVHHRISLGVEWMPIQFLEIRPEIRFADVSQDEGGNIVDHTETTALVQTHIYF